MHLRVCALQLGHGRLEAGGQGRHQLADADQEGVHVGARLPSESSHQVIEFVGKVQEGRSHQALAVAEVPVDGDPGDPAVSATSSMETRRTPRATSRSRAASRMRRRVVRTTPVI